MAEISIDLSTVFVGAGLPAPEKEYRFHPERQWRFDYAWPDYRVAFEREGGTWAGGRHTRGIGYQNDCVKYTVAAILGWIVVRATSDMLRDGSALKLLEKALMARGWRMENE